MEYKDDVIHVQLDGLTYLIHTRNCRCLVPDKDRKLIYRAKNCRTSEENTKHVLIDIPIFSLNHESNDWKNQVWLHQSITSATKLFLSKVTWIIFIQKQNALEVWR